MTASRSADAARRRRFGAARAVPAFAALALACGTPSLAGRSRTLEASYARAAAEAQPSDDAPASFDGAPVLERAALVAEVLRRNPTLEAARQAWRAALARPAQERSLDDPMLGLSLAPWSLGSGTVDPGYTIEISQALPFPGKLALREEVALAEAEATAHDYEATRLRIALIASRLYDDYYLAARTSEIDAHHVALLERLQPVALARYEAGEASQQDPLQAETEKAMLEHEQILAETDGRVAAERIDALLHRPPDHPLPAPPSRLESPPPAPADDESLLREAVSARPELQAADARASGRERAVDLAQREFLPDFGVFARYDKVWQEKDLQPMVGLQVQVPLRLDRRRAALDEARAELARSRSERARTEDAVRLDVVSAAERLREAHHLYDLARERLVPAARDRAVAARAAYESGKEAFATLIDAERGRRETELELERSLVNVLRRHFELERALGRAAGLGQEGRP